MPGKFKIPAGDKIVIDHGKLQVPDRPVIAFIEGDASGPDIWKASTEVKCSQFGTAIIENMAKL
jgi:isocitrate dehydrogenase